MFARDPRTDAELVTVQRKPKAIPMCVTPRTYKATSSAERMETLPVAGLVYRYDQAVCRSVAMIIPKGQGMRSFRLVSSYREVSTTIEQTATLIQYSEALERLFAGARAFYKLDLI